jgi:hypothetical protein
MWPRNSTLLSSCPAQITPTSPCAFTVTVNKTPVTITFPAPVVARSLKTRIARTSSYIELVAVIIPNPAVHPSATFTSPLLFSNYPNNTHNPVPIEHIARAASKGLKAAMELKRLRRLSPLTARQLFTSMVAPVVD